MASTEGSIRREGFDLKYCIVGQGPTAIVFGSSVYYQRSFSQELRKHLRLVFVDWRGFGDPIAGEKQSDISFDMILDDIEYIRQTLGIKTCIIIGHSAHGLIALEYAKKYPQNVSHVVMIGSPPNLGAEMAAMAERYWQESVWPERKAALENRRKLLPDDALGKLPPSERFVAWCVRRAPQTWYDYNFDSSPLWEGIHPNMSMLDYLYGVALRDLDVTRGLESLTQPVFLALGRYDFVVAPASSWDPIRPKFQDLTVRVFERSGHSPHYEEAPLFNDELLRWISSPQDIAMGKKI